MPAEQRDRHGRGDARALDALDPAEQRRPGCHLSPPSHLRRHPAEHRASSAAVITWPSSSPGTARRAGHERTDKTDETPGARPRVIAARGDLAQLRAPAQLRALDLDHGAHGRPPGTKPRSTTPSASRDTAALDAVLRPVTVRSVRALRLLRACTNGPRRALRLHRAPGQR
jgi:hypothetical protein